MASRHRIPLRSEESTMNDIIMGVVSMNPEQAPYERVLVCFNFHAGQTIEGVVVRNDMTTPGR